MKNSILFFVILVIVFGVTGCKKEVEEVSMISLQKKGNPDHLQSLARSPFYKSIPSPPELSCRGFYLVYSFEILSLY